MIVAHKIALDPNNVQATYFWLYAVLCGNASRHVGMAGANGLAGRCLSLDMRR